MDWCQPWRPPPFGCHSLINDDKQQQHSIIKLTLFTFFSYIHSLVVCCWIRKMTSGYTTGGIVSSIHQYTDWSQYPALSGKSGRSCPPDFHPLANKSADETRVPHVLADYQLYCNGFFPTFFPPILSPTSSFASQWDKCRIEIRYTLYVHSVLSLLFYILSLFRFCSVFSERQVRAFHTYHWRCRVMWINGEK